MPSTSQPGWPVLHPVVAAIEGDLERLGISPSAVPRALRTLRALLLAAEARGWRAEACGPRERAIVRVVAGTHHYPVTLSEEYVRTPHLPTEHEIDRVARSPWVRLPEHDRRQSWKLTTSLPMRWIQGSVQGHRRRWSDRNRWRLENKLGQVLAEIAAHVALDAKLDAEESERHAAEFRRFDRAWERLVTEHRAGYLRNQVDTLRFADAIRTYCTTLRAGPATAGARGWLNWAVGYADQIDPRLHAPAMPDDPQPDFDALAPYLDGEYSVYEKRKRWREWRQTSEVGGRFPEPDDLLDF